MSEHKQCIELFERLSELLDGELDRITGDEIKAHIEDCPQCQVCWATLRKSVEIFRNLGPETVPADFLAELKKAVTSCEDE